MNFHPQPATIIEILEPFLDKSNPDIKKAFNSTSFNIDVKDIYDSNLNKKLVQVRNENAQKFKRYMEIIEFLMQLFEEKADAYTPKESSIHSLDALDYKAHNQLEFSHSSESYALAFED